MHRIKRGKTESVSDAHIVKVNFLSLGGEAKIPRAFSRGAASFFAPWQRRHIPVLACLTEETLQQQIEPCNEQTV